MSVQWSFPWWPRPLKLQPYSFQQSWFRFLIYFPQGTLLSSVWILLNLPPLPECKLSGGSILFTDVCLACSRCSINVEGMNRLMCEIHETYLFARVFILNSRASDRDMLTKGSIWQIIYDASVNICSRNLYFYFCDF